MVVVDSSYGMVVSNCAAPLIMLARVRRWLRASAPPPLGRWAVTGDWETRAMLATMDSCCCTSTVLKRDTKELPVATSDNGVRVRKDAGGDVLGV